MNHYEIKKNRLRHLVNEFDLFDDISKLAEAFDLNRDIIRVQGFPIKEFRKWQKKLRKLKR